MIVIASCTPLAAHAACQRPSAISVPNGATATFEALLAAQSDVKSYLAAMESYLACINEELAVDGDDAPTEFQSALTTMHSEAAIELETLAVAFSRELQAFWNAHPELRTQARTESALRQAQ